MKKQTYIPLFLLLAAILTGLLCSCSEVTFSPIHEGETYLDGSWYFSEGGLNVGYNLFSDGGGYQFIGETVNPIRYGIYEGELYIAVNGGNAVSFPFSASEEGITIGGLLYLPVEEDPVVAASIAATLSTPEPEEKETHSQLFFLFCCALAVGIVVAVALLLLRLRRSPNRTKRK